MLLRFRVKTKCKQRTGTGTDLHTAVHLSVQTVHITTAVVKNGFFECFLATTAVPHPVLVVARRGDELT